EGATHPVQQLCLTQRRRGNQAKQNADNACGSKCEQQNAQIYMNRIDARQIGRSHCDKNSGKTYRREYARDPSAESEYHAFREELTRDACARTAQGRTYGELGIAIDAGAE